VSFRKVPEPEHLPSIRLRFVDLFGEALSAILARPGRAGLTVLGTVLGIAAFVAVLGLTATASGQIDKHFSALTATEITIEDAPVDPAVAGQGFPEDAEAKAKSIIGVREAGLYFSTDVGRVSGQPYHLARDVRLDAAVLGASPGYLHAAHARVSTGRLFDSLLRSRGERVAVIGRGLAAELGIGRLDAQQAIFLDGTPFTVIGVVDEVDRDPAILKSVIVPDVTARKEWGTSVTNTQGVRMLVDTDLGAAQAVGRQLPVALRPDQPERFRVKVPPDPRFLKGEVSGELNGLFLALAGLCLIVGAAGIANTIFVSVLERIGEIGLRRALGAGRRQIAAQFLAESAALGFLGGLIGMSVGVCTVVGVAYFQQWTPVLEPLTVLPSPLAGALVGLIAGLVPSWRAGLIEPVEALRR